MKTLTAATALEAAARIKRPLWLVQIDFAAPVRLCSWGDVAWNGHDWIGADLRVDLVESGPNGEQGGSIELGNTDLAWSALILAEGVADRPISIWGAYAGAIAADDPLHVFDGVGDDAEIGPDRCRISLSSASAARIKSPREFGGDFTLVQPAGTVVNFNGERYVLEPG